MREEVKNMDFSPGQFISKFNIPDSNVVTILRTLDQKVLLSKGEHEYRYNILGTRHKTHTTTYKDGTICEKEYAYGHLMAINKKIYFSQRTTQNADREEHIISSTIYNCLLTDEIHDIDRNARLIDDTNVSFIVNTILGIINQEIK